MNEPKFLAVLKLKSLIELPSPKRTETVLIQPGIPVPLPNYRYAVEPDNVKRFDEILPLYLMLRPDDSTVCISPTGRALGKVGFSMPFPDIAVFLNTEVQESTPEQRLHGYGDIIFLRDEATTTAKYLERLHKLAVLTAE